MLRSRGFAYGCACLALVSRALSAQTLNPDAKAFGALPWASDAELSPDAKHLVFIAPTVGGGTAAVIEDLTSGDTSPILAGDGKMYQIRGCGWSANDRIVCRLWGAVTLSTLGQPIAFARTVALGIDGKHQIPLSTPNQDGARVSVDDGRVIDWLSGEDGAVLMQRDVVRQRNMDTNITRNADGLSVERVDTRTNRGMTIERPSTTADSYITDGAGKVRIAVRTSTMTAQVTTETVDYRYRLATSRDWLPFSRIDGHGPGLRPIAVDGTSNVAYALDRRDGRDALYRVALDGSLKAELVYADPVVDVEGVVTIGRHGRVIGASYVTDRRQVLYFDPEYEKLAAGLAKGLPKTPLIHFASASADERKLLIFASGDTDPGHFYLLDRDTSKMTEVLQSRPGFAGRPLAGVKAISYRAADGTSIPAYLTLPPGSAGKKLPAIVLPHGGPADRDEWGFDWLSQYFAARGFAVLQPQYRGSTGYGEGFLNGNGMKSWRVAIGDVLDAGRWLNAQGIADPEKLAIFGWSYGGYAALQSQVLDPDLFKAAVAVAPVTDFDMLREQYRIFTNFEIISRYIGAGPEADAGSPERHPDGFKAPVMIFHGDHDLTVDIAQSRAMDGALRRAGKTSRLVTYPGLGHSLEDGSARTDMLTQADAFLRASLKLP